LEVKPKTILGTTYVCVICVIMSSLKESAIMWAQENEELNEWHGMGLMINFG
jgi:hypothetical protein